MSRDRIDDLDQRGVLRAVEDALARRRRAEAEDLELVCHWADLHAADPNPIRWVGGSDDPDRWLGRDRLIEVGGDGPPRAGALHPGAGGRTTHPRPVHPRRPGRRARPAAPAAPHLGARPDRRLRGVGRAPGRLRGPRAHRFRVGLVDDAVAAAVATESPGRVLELAAAKVIEADPEGYAARLDEKLRRRFVSLSRTEQHGLCHVIAHVEAGAAAWVDSLVDQVADALDLRRQADPAFLPELPADVGRDELRSVAFGWLAHPERVLELLDDPSGQAQAAVEDEPVDETAPTPKPRARAVVYLHLSEAALSQHGVARVEGLGPMLMEQVTRLLRHANVELHPVIDLADRVRVNAYEHPEAVKLRTHLRCIGDVFPHATRVSRRVDIDHPDPYRHDGTSGQTGDHNAAPLSRTPHRAKTHLGYQLHQLDLGAYLWRTPHGLYRLVDHTGTTVLDEDVGENLLQTSRDRRSAKS